MWYFWNRRCSIHYLHFLRVILILRMILYLISSLRFLPLSVELVHPISDESRLADLTSDESPPADPTSEESSTANPTFDESPLSAPAANPVNTTALESRRSHRVSTLPSYLRDFHCFFAFATLHEPHTFREASFNPFMVASYERRI
jgi:hypothetical protein